MHGGDTDVDGAAGAAALLLLREDADKAEDDEEMVVVAVAGRTGSGGVAAIKVAATESTVSADISDGMCAETRMLPCRPGARLTDHDQLLLPQMLLLTVSTEDDDCSLDL